MNFLWWEIRKRIPANLSPPSSRGGWYPMIRESFAGAWQQNVEVRPDSVLAYHAVFACITLISADIGKLRQKLVSRSPDGIWSETDSPAFSPVLRKPNGYQNHIQFKEWWITSKLIRGNTYALKQRDARGVVTTLYLLDSARVKPLVAPSGEVFYQLDQDNLAGLENSVTVPASEIIHDRMNCLFHPLVGLSPIYACGLGATQGLAIQDNSAQFFQNLSRPSGILTAPGAISNETAGRLKEAWQTNYGGANYGKVAVLGDDLKYQPITLTAVEAQMIEQLRWTAEIVCSVFHVPPFKIGLGQIPAYQNTELLNQVYYSDCLQSLIEQYELCMDEGLGLGETINGRWLGVELDLDGLMRMDSATMINTLAAGVGGGIVAPNEARKKLDLGPVTGGDSPLLQQQNYSLEALARRDAQEDPFGSAKPPELPKPEPADEEGEDDEAEEERAIMAVVLKRAEQFRKCA
jgi:HK97 family phage portal protein